METPKKYRVILSKTADKQLRKLDKYTFNIITAWIRKNLDGCDNPRQKGKALVENHNGEWRYRVGDYRIIAEIHDDEVLILVLEVGHRREIYE